MFLEEWLGDINKSAKKILLRFSEIPDQEAFYLTGEIEVTPKIGPVSPLVLLFYYRNYRNYVPLLTELILIYTKQLLEP